MDHLVFEVGLALALLAAAALVSNRLRFSVVPFLILVGMAVGPHAPHVGILDLRFIQTAPLIAFMGRLGILFLVFYLGLEFSVGRLFRARRSVAIGGTIYIGIHLALGFLYGWLLGWPAGEMLVAAGVMVISSSAIVAKLLVDLRRTTNPETELILGILMFQDIFMAVYLTVTTGVVLSGAASPAAIALSSGLALGFIAAFLLVGRRMAGRLNRWLNIPSDETFLLVLFAALLLVAGFSETVHVAEAIGALMVGMVLAETEHVQRIEHLILPFRDFFGALFFFSFGLSIDPLALGGAVWPALGAVALTLAGSLASGVWAGRSVGLSPRASVATGLTLVSRGEFSIIVADVGRAAGLLPVLQPFSALYVLVLAVVGPLVTRYARPIFAQLNAFFRWQPKPPAPERRPAAVQERKPQ